MITITKPRIENIKIPGESILPGLNIRCYQGESDLPSIVALNNLVSLADQNDEIETVEQLAHHFRHLKNCDPYEDILLGEIDGQLIVYSRVWWVEEADGTFLYRSFGNIHPDWRGKGLGTALLPFNEDRLREMAHANDHPVDAPGYFESWGGYPMPDGLEVRAFKGSHTRFIWEAIDEAFRDHWGYVESTDDDYQRFLNSPTLKPDLWHVAWDGDQVAGMVLNNYFEEENKTFNRKRGWTDPICVRRPWRRRGLARALLVNSIQMFKEMGFDDTALGVDTDNPNGARMLYETVGYTTDKTWMAYRKPFTGTKVW
jgi:GNAT superfamily N-acetyltransferase